MKAIKDLKKGDFFTLKELENPKEEQVWIRYIYDRSSKRYICYNFTDFNRCRLFKGSKMVFDEEYFTF